MAQWLFSLSVNIGVYIGLWIAEFSSSTRVCYLIFHETKGISWYKLFSFAYFNN